jgi:phosphate transport system protein
MRTAFDQQLDALTAAIAEMCALAGRAMRDATQALLQADAALAERVIDEHDKIMLNGARAEQDAFALLALQVLVAGDLRAVVASLKNVADAERMGVLALHVAQIVRRCHPAHALPEEVNGYFAEMGRIAVDLGNNAKDVVQSGDPRKAAQLRHDDDAMDDLHRQLFTLLMDQQWKHGVAAAVDVTLLGRYYERFADHAVEIGRRVIFQATGTIKTSISRNTPTVDDLRNPLLAAVGAVDLALQQLNEIIDAVRERTEEARSDASTRAEETRERLTKRREELRERLSGEELRKAYESLVERGQAALERLRTRTRKAAPAKKAPAKKAPAKKAPAKKAPAKKTTKK